MIYSCARISSNKCHLRSRDPGAKSRRCRCAGVGDWLPTIYLYITPLLFFFLTLRRFQAALPALPPLFSPLLSLDQPAMRLTASYVLPVLSFPALALANSPHHNRQVASAVSSAVSSALSPAVSSSAAAAASSSPTGSSVSVSGSTSLFPTPTAATPSFTLASTNPNAVPLASIVVNAPSPPISPLPTPYPAGSKPSSIPNAPPLPDSEP